MNIKRFVAADAREGLAAVRASLGEDAVILSNRRVAGGVEIVAAVDYNAELDAELEDDTAELSGDGIDRLLNDALSSALGGGGRTAAAEPSGPVAVAAARPAADAARDGAEELREELRDLRRLLESQ